MLYRVAMALGFRRNELGSLTPSSFHLEGPLPFVVLEAKRAKNKKRVEQPIPPALAADLRVFLVGRPADLPVWDITDKQVDYVIRDDLTDAGIPIRVEGRVADFHALRVSMITSLCRAGVPLATAQKLARHSDPRLTSTIYTQLDASDLSRAVGGLPDFGARKQGPTWEAGS